MSPLFRVLLVSTCLLPLALPAVQEANATLRVLVASQATPAGSEDKARVLAENKALFALPPEMTPAHPAAAHYPGLPADGAQAVTREITLVHKQASELQRSIARRHLYSGETRPTWYSTGLYAAPGTVITLSAEGLADKKATVRIGSHSDSLEHSRASRWTRMPIISKDTPITQNVTRVANPFGGLIYITIPTDASDFTLSVKVENAIPAPLYQFGKTTPEEWAKMQQSQAPWGELVSDRVVLTIPTNTLRAMQDPEACLKLWNKILETERALANHPVPQYRPFRIVPDIQPSAGYMHSGYPIVAGYNKESDATGAIAVMAHPELLTKPSNGGANWGYFHEIGHNYQNIDWVWDGLTEVTVNLFSLYCFDHVVGTRDRAHYGVSPEETKKMMDAYFNAPDYEKWKRSAFLALCTFRQLQDEFGWDAYKKTFAEYLKLSDAERPRDNQAKRDMFMVKFSQTVGKNLGPFFKAWHIPVTDAACDSIKSLPVWMPKNFPPSTTPQP